MIGVLWAANETTTASNATEAAAHLDLVIVVAVLATIVALVLAAAVVWAVCSCIHSNSVCSIMRRKGGGGGGVGCGGGGGDCLGTGYSSCQRTSRFPPPRREHLELVHLPGCSDPQHEMVQITGNDTGISQGLGLNMGAYEREEVPSLAAPKSWTPSPPFETEAEPKPPDSQPQKQQYIAYRVDDGIRKSTSYNPTPFNTLSSKGWSENRDVMTRADNQSRPDTEDKFSHPVCVPRRYPCVGGTCVENPRDLSYPQGNPKRRSRDHEGQAPSLSCPDVRTDRCECQRRCCELVTPADARGTQDHLEVPRLEHRRPRSRLYAPTDQHPCPRCAQLPRCTCTSPTESTAEILRNTGNSRLKPAACSSTRSSLAKKASSVVSLHQEEQCARYTRPERVTPTYNSPGFSDITVTSKNQSHHYYHEHSTYQRPESPNRRQNQDTVSDAHHHAVRPKRYKSRLSSASSATSKSRSAYRVCTPVMSHLAEDGDECQTVVRKSQLERKYGVIPKDQMDKSWRKESRSRCGKHSSTALPPPELTVPAAERGYEAGGDTDGVEFDWADEGAVGGLPASTYPLDRQYYITCPPPSQDEESDEAASLEDDCIYV